MMIKTQVCTPTHYDRDQHRARVPLHIADCIERAFYFGHRRFNVKITELPDAINEHTDEMSYNILIECESYWK